MKGTSRSPVKRNDGFHRYMKPGALAQMRNTRINARSTSPVTRSLAHPIDLASPSQSSAGEATTAPLTPTTDQVPHLLRKIYGPYCMKRKKLAAARSVSLMVMMMMNPSSNSTIEPTVDNSSVLNNDVAAH